MVQWLDQVIDGLVRFGEDGPRLAGLAGEDARARFGLVERNAANGHLQFLQFFLHFRAFVPVAKGEAAVDFRLTLILAGGSEVRTEVFDVVDATLCCPIASASPFRTGRSAFRRGLCRQS